MSHLVKALAVYYWSYHRWNGSPKIRAWELRRTKVAILLAGTIYRMSLKGHVS